MGASAESATVRVLSSITDVDAGEWDAPVRDNYPFLWHAFLAALEAHHCVGTDSGWVPRHLAHFRNDRLVGAMPLFEKYNSWGEFVFDHAWADAYERYGMEYYPKLVNAIPFTPASGQRVLLDSENEAEIAGLLVAAANKLVKDAGYSGIHTLFPGERDFTLLNRGGAVSRNDCQFHWHNRGYRGFEDFLEALKSRKRKKIRQERRRVDQAGLEIQRLTGESASEEDWRDFTRLYRSIYNRKYGLPAFNLGFFMEVAATLGRQIHLVLAREQGHSVAGALMYSDDNTLYGRHWGCENYVDCLHFELCYYQGIELCLEAGLDRFDPGAQGEHKIARGFEAHRTRSLHWMAESPFNQAIRRFVDSEQAGVSRYIDQVRAHSPFRSEHEIIH